jgi:trans-aconitate 2-methyltransferase
MRPALELLARLDDPGTCAVWDLGCGTGNVTAHLAARFERARVFGLDSSDEMLERARDIPGISWVRGDIAAWEPDEPAGMIFANASLHWVPDHPRLIPKLMRALAHDGQLAVQMPANWGEPSHQLLAATARSRRWRATFPVVPGPPPIAPAETYYDLVSPLAAAIDLWHTTYTHVLRGDHPVAEWTRGSAARPFLEQAGDRAEEFFAEYTAAVDASYPRRADGSTLLPFRRLFLVARRSGSGALR